MPSLEQLFCLSCCTEEARGRVLTEDCILPQCTTISLPAKEANPAGTTLIVEQLQQLDNVVRPANFEEELSFKGPEPSLPTLIKGEETWPWEELAPPSCSKTSTAASDPAGPQFGSPCCSEGEGELVLGGRVRARMPIQYRFATVPAGALGRLVALEPTARVNWDGFDGLAMAVVRTDQVDAAVLEQQEPREFTATLKKKFTDQRLGLHLDLSDGERIHVCSIREGTYPVTAYNADAPEELRLRAGDYIVGVNGVSGNAYAMMDECKAGDVLELTVRRPLQMVTEVCRGTGQLGLGLKHAGRTRSLLVETVLPGPVAAWNAANPGLEMRAGDRIIAVNGVTGSTHELLHALNKDGVVALLLTRPAEVK